MANLVLQNLANALIYIMSGISGTVSSSFAPPDSQGQGLTTDDADVGC
jgi:hypothetical protein